MTTAKRGGSKKAGKAGKSGKGRQSPPSRARQERKRKSTARRKGDGPEQAVPKIGKGEIGAGKSRGGGLLH